MTTEWSGPSGRYAVAATDVRSATDFRQSPAEHAERINGCGRPEIMTVNGRAALVLVPPALFDEMVRKAEAMDLCLALAESERDREAGRVRSVEETFDAIRQRLGGGRRESA